MAAKLSSIVRPIADWWSHRTLAQRFATLTAILIAGAAIIQGAVLVGVASHVVNGLASARVEQRLDKAGAQLTTHVNEFRKIPLILSGTPPIERIVALSTGGAPRLGESLKTWLHRLSIIFRSIVQANPEITQARLIGVADGGRELVRVNRVGRTIEIVDKVHLQQKGDRPYFAETIKLRAGEVYLSPIEPNVEYGVEQQPLQPTIRAGTPIYTEQGNVFGVIVVNATTDAWLSEISAISGVSGKFFAADRHGDYIFRSDHGPIFGAQEGLSTARFLRDWPQLADAFSPEQPKTASVQKDDEFMAARRVDYNRQDPSDFVVLAANSDSSAVFGRTRRLILLGAAIALAMAGIGVLAAYFVSRPLKGLMTAAKKIAEGKLDATDLAKDSQGAEIGELGGALRIMKDAIGTRDDSLRKSEANLQAIIDNTIDGVINIDTSGTIRSFNRGCEEIFGYTTSEVVGRNVDLLVPTADADRYTGLLERYARTGNALFAGRRQEIKGRHKSGRLLDLEVAIAEIKVEDGVLFSSIVRDITERKQMERIKSEFVSTVSHELRTPLTAIMGSLGLLRSGAFGDISPKAAHMIDLAHDNGTRLVALINNILDIDKIEGGEFEVKQESVCLKLLIEQTAKQNATYATQHAASILVEDIADDIIVDTDAERFYQVMGNLLTNAAKFSPKGGAIRIAAGMTEKMVRISVHDEGPGIPEAFRDRIFHKFAQADSSDTREKGGTGLGLCITKAIVERLGGAIGYETQIGAGTTFYFDLPAHRADPAQDAPRADGDSLAAMQRSA
jgi:PAS domain S-box-containing protein